MKRLSLILLLITIFACKKETPYVPENKMEADVKFLSDDKLEGRVTGSEGEKLAADYIAKRFEELGLQPKGNNGYYQEFTFKPKTDPHSQVSFTEANADSTITGRNVLGYLDNKAAQTIVIGAHYDHLGYNEYGGSLYRGEDKQIHNGADDNASGVAMMLNLAAKLKETNTSNNYLFMSFSGEEMGLLGSNYFVKNATIPVDSINYMINMDMVGRLKDSTLAVYGVGTSPIFKQVLNAHNDGFKIKENESGVGPSDHTSFYLNDVPVLHFFTGQHEDYHKPTDDFDKLNYKGMNQVSDYIFNIITDLDDNGELAFRKTKNESDKTPRFTVTLGVVPDYMYDGKGMRIDGVSEEKPAQKAGLQKGDVVIQMGEHKVEDMMGYMKALSKFKKGDTTTVKVQRGNELIDAAVIF
jgi:Zn-dependent M28 family amino/carboxypeptidase